MSRNNAIVVLSTVFFLVSALLCATYNRTTHGSTEAVANTLYVSANGNCGSVSPCYTSIQDAVTDANDGDIIKIAQGTYTSRLMQVVYVDKSVTLDGGYNTADWEHPYPTTQPTVLDAQNLALHRGLVLGGTDDPSIVVQGLTIQNGGNSLSTGGGVFVNPGIKAVISDCLVISNTAGSEGGGIYVNNGAISIVNSTIVSNYGQFNGGGLFAWQSQGVTVTDSSFIENASNQGGAIYANQSSLLLSGNIFHRNNTYIDRGVVDIEQSSSMLISNTFTSNTGGRGVFSVEGGRQNISHVTDTLFLQNSGGGVGVSGASVIITHSYFISNTTLGGLNVYNGSANLFNNIFQANTSSSNGGAISLRDSSLGMSGNLLKDNSASNLGGAIWSNEGSVITAENDIIADNKSAQEGVSVGGVLTARHWTVANNGDYAVTALGNQTVTLTDTVVSTHTLAGLWGTMRADHMLIFNSGISCGGGAICTSALKSDPSFISPQTGDYHLCTHSPAIDSGVDAQTYVDIDGNPRPQGRSFDIGADEWMVYAGVSSYNGIPLTTLGNVYLPLVTKLRCGEESTIAVQNITTQVLTLTLTYQMQNGDPDVTRVVTLPAQAMTRYAYQDIPSNTFAGSVVISGTSGVAAIVDDIDPALSGDGLSSYSGNTNPSRKWIFLDVKPDVAGHSSQLVFQNTSDITATTVVSFYSSAGNVVAISNMTKLPPHKARGFTMSDLASLPSDFIGTAYVSADQPIVALLNEFDSVFSTRKISTPHLFDSDEQYVSPVYAGLWQLVNNANIS